MSSFVNTNFPVELIQSMIETFPMPCFYKDRKGLYQNSNELFAKKILGLEKADFFGKGIKELFCEIPEDLASRYISQDERLFSNESLQVYESQVMCSSKERHLFRFIKSCVKNSSGEVVGLLGFMVDLDGHIDATSLFGVDKNIIELGKKSSMINHEVGTPLIVIERILNKILKKSEGCLDDAMGFIHSEAKRGLNSVTYMKEVTSWVNEMNFSSNHSVVEVSGGEVTLKNFFINDILSDALEITKQQILRDGIEINFPNFSDTQNLKVNCQNTQLIQTFINILNNSKDAISELNEKWISISIVTDGSFVSIRFTDSGEGISLNLKNDLFKSGTTTKLKGHGIGLNLCQKVVNENNGEIYLDKDKLNTTFVVKLPLSD